VNMFIAHCQPHRGSQKPGPRPARTRGIST
jgi:hypothetical protein